MKLLGDKILVKFSQESIDSIYLGREIVRDDGSKVRLFLTMEGKHDEDRRAAQTIQVAHVVGISPNVNGIEVGDLALVNYDLFNMVDHIVSKDESGAIYWLNATTTYHTEQVVANANRKSAREQIVQSIGDYEEISLLLAIVRNDKLYAREPFVFFEHTDPDIDRRTKSGIIYNEQRSYFDRRILSASDATFEKFSLKEGDKVLTYESDIFEVKLEGRSVDCCYDIDVACRVL